MKKIDPGQTIAILANLGVIAGIVFLAVELRQNNELIAADARFNRLSVAIGSATLLAQSPDLTRLYVRVANGEALAPDEQYRVDMFFRRVFLNIEWTFNELSDAEYPMGRWRTIMQNPPQQKYWEENKGQFSDEFVAFFEENVLDQSAWND